MRSEELALLFNSLYATQLQQIFDCYAKLKDPQIDNTVLQNFNVIQCKSFYKFARHFGIAPDILDEAILGYVFDDVVKHKKGYGRDCIRAMTYADFLESLIKLCILTKHQFAEVGEYTPSNDFDVNGLTMTMVEKFLKFLGLVAGEREGPIMQQLKRIKQENDKEIYTRVGTKERSTIKGKDLYISPQEHIEKLSHNKSFTEVKDIQSKNGEETMKDSLSRINSPKAKSKSEESAKQLEVRESDIELMNKLKEQAEELGKMKEDLMGRKETINDDKEEEKLWKQKVGDHKLEEQRLEEDKAEDIIDSAKGSEINPTDTIDKDITKSKDISEEKLPENNTVIENIKDEGIRKEEKFDNLGITTNEEDITEAKKTEASKTESYQENTID